MGRNSLKKEARLYYLPLLLGSNAASHRAASLIFKKQGILSFIFDGKPRLGDIFSLSSHFVPLSTAEDPRLICEELISHAEQNPSNLLILAAFTKEYRQLIHENRQLLESYFIISSPEELLHSSPLADI